MSIVVLHQGEDWLFPASGYDIEKFHPIALEHGSRARWLPITGTLVTDDPKEKALHYPYEDWRKKVLKAIAD